MKYFLKSFLFLTIFVIAACSDSSDSTLESLSQTSDQESVEPQLVLTFELDPLEPKVFNIAVSDESQEQDFNPGEQIRTTWVMSLKYSDNTNLKEGESHLYDAKVYLSSDNEIDELDLELFSIECSFPETEEYACGRFASFITDYAPDNQNIFSTDSIPLEKSLGLTDYQVDSTAFLDTIPKETNLIISACLKDQPDNCDLFSIGISLL